MNFLNILGFFYITLISGNFTFPFLSNRKYILLDDESSAVSKIQISNLSEVFEVKLKNKIKQICVKECLKMLQLIKSSDLKKKTNIVSKILKHKLGNMGRLGLEILSELKEHYNIVDTIY